MVFLLAAKLITTKFMYDGTDLIAETNASNGILRRYVHGPETDDPIVWYEGSGTGDKRYYTANRQGSIVGVTLQSGMSTSVNSYDEYGIQKLSTIGRFQYTGQTWIPEIGLYYYKARFYNPNLGRFMQTDPIGYRDGMNWYAYTGNDPVNNFDPSGKNTVAGATAGCAASGPACPVGAVVGAVVGTVAGAKAVDAASDMLSGNEEGIPRPNTDGPEMEPSDIPRPGDKPSLLDEKSRKHTLDGDANGVGGGHRPGTGRPGKSEFPEGWSDGKIEGEISDVATAPDSPWSEPDDRGYIDTSGTRDGVDIRVIVDKIRGRIVTGYPTNRPRNPR